MLLNFLLAVCLEVNALLWMAGVKLLSLALLAVWCGLLIWRAAASGAGRPQWPKPGRAARIAASLVFLLVVGVLLREFLPRGGRGEGQAAAKVKGIAAPMDAASRGVILRPKPQLIRLVPPRPRLFNFEEKRSVARKRELIPFRGVYWIYQPPDFRPPPSSPTLEGSPSQFRFRSNDESRILLATRETFETKIGLAGMRGIELEFLSDDESIPAIEVRMVLWNRSTLPFQMKRFGSAKPMREGESWRVRFVSEGGWYLQEMDGMDLLFLPAENTQSVVPRLELLGFRFF